MSTSLDRVKGVTESGDSELDITRFYGGIEKGSMIQLTPISHDGYIQLTEQQCINLAKILLNAFNYKIYPSE